jgi:hypothetical protein
MEGTRPPSFIVKFITNFNPMTFHYSVGKSSMALLMSATLPSGVSVDKAYWRLNSFEQLPNRQADGTYAVPAIALFRAFASEDAFKSNKPYILEHAVTFTPSSISANLAEEAYTAFRNLDPTTEIKGELESHNESLISVNGQLEDLHDKLAEKDVEIAKLKEEDSISPYPNGPLFASKMYDLKLVRDQMQGVIDNIENQSVELMTKVIPETEDKLKDAQFTLEAIQSATNV